MRTRTRWPQPCASSRARPGWKAYLEQLQTFASRHRDSRGWSVSIAHYALVPWSQIESVKHEHLKWRPVDSIRSLPFDHLEILRTAVSRVRSKTLYSSLPVAPDGAHVYADGVAAGV